MSLYVFVDRRTMVAFVCALNGNRFHPQPMDAKQALENGARALRCLIKLPDVSHIPMQALAELAKGSEEDPMAVSARRRIRFVQEVDAERTKTPTPRIHQASSGANSPNIVTGDWQSVHPGMRMRRPLLGPEKEAR